MVNQPIIKIVSLHIRALKAIRALDLPADGLGWGDAIPDEIVLGGINGSGKTTLLEFLFFALRSMTETTGASYAVYRNSQGNFIPGPPTQPKDPIVPPEAAEALADIEIGGGELPRFRGRLVVGNAQYVQANLVENGLGCISPGGGFSRTGGSGLGALGSIVRNPIRYVASAIPSVVYLPSERPTVVASSRAQHALVRLVPPDDFAYRWQPSSTWDGSIEALLYAARWADLNAKEMGKPELAIHFAAYAKAFNEFFEGAKSLEWSSDGELHVRLRDGKVHDLGQLSSGEAQVIVLASQLLLRWRPGSLILIDEPELHLHTHWQTKLWELLTRFRAERGGQIVVATQSAHLFGLAETGTSVLLGGRSL